MKWCSFILIIYFLATPPVSLLALEQSCSEPETVIKSEMSSHHCEDCSAEKNDRDEISLKPEQASKPGPYSRAVLCETSAVSAFHRQNLQISGVPPNTIHTGSTLHLYCALLI